ncbi:hypothetical protein [Clostridium sp.]|jgi:hypothetical protein|uniref:hypothetical protein n=1 Tax=Clostridium sp. TaxID=1506 RepID=UPI0025D34FF9|nr:hypothetical protein [Clostridium sp.]MDY2631639.1 hypothetical protein [Clostridium sp.]
MFISIPKDFFVPVVFSDDFRYNSENNSMEYDTEYSNLNSNSRKKLQDLEYIDCRGEDTGYTAEYMEDLININDKKIQEQILNYSKSFMKFIEELKRANCLDKNGFNIGKLINYYAKAFRNLYNDYRKLIINVGMPISQSDENQIIDKYIGELEDIYNNNLKELNCKNLNYDEIEATMDTIFNNAREILKEEIRNINCELVNIRSVCKSSMEIENNFKQGENLYSKLDNEFLTEMENR